MDNLEQFIRDNREDFDTKTPSLKIWSELDKKLTPPSSVPQFLHEPVAKRIPIRRILSIAAAVTLLIGFGVGIGFSLAPSNNHQIVSLSDISPEYAEVEQYYATQVSNKLATLTTYEATTPEIKADLAELDAWMKDLQKELSLVPKSKEETVINDIIDLYKTKVAILEKLLDNIQSTNQKNNNHNETVDI